MPRDARGNFFLATEVFNDFLTIIGAPLQRNGRAVKIAVKNRILTTLAFCARGSNIFLTTQLLRLKILTASSWGHWIVRSTISRIGLSMDCTIHYFQDMKIRFPISRLIENVGDLNFQYFQDRTD